MASPTLRTQIPLANLQQQPFDWGWFFKLTVGGIYGTLRYCDLGRPIAGLGKTFTGNIDGTSQTWTERFLDCPGFNQDNAGLESVQYIDIDNLDWALSTIGADVGLLGVPYELWIAFFAADGVTVAGSYQASVGLVDEVQYDTTARLALKANATYWGRRILGPPLGPLCMFYYREPNTCQYSGIASYTITNGGSGYTSAPGVTVAAPVGGGTAATAVASFSGGVVTAVTMVTPGSGYASTEQPALTFSGGGGSGAAGHGNAEPAGQTTCDKTRSNGCTPRGNNTRFGGFDLALPPLTIIYWQQLQIVAGGGGTTEPTNPPVPNSWQDTTSPTYTGPTGRVPGRR